LRGATRRGSPVVGWRSSNNINKYTKVTASFLDMAVLDCSRLTAVAMTVFLCCHPMPARLWRSSNDVKTTVCIESFGCISILVDRILLSAYSLLFDISKEYEQS